MTGLPVEHGKSLTCIKADWLLMKPASKATRCVRA